MNEQLSGRELKLTFSRFEIAKAVNVFGNPPSALRRAIMMMRRRGSGWKVATQAVAIANSVHAGHRATLSALEEKKDSNS